MFEPVTMTRSTSPVGGGATAPVGGGAGGGGFCANAFDTMMRGIPTQAARVMRRNPELESPVLVMFSPLVRLGFSLKCHTIVTLQSKRLRKIEENGKTFFAFRKYFLKSRRPCADCTSKQRLPKSKQFLVSRDTARKQLSSRKAVRAQVRIRATNSRKVACLEGFEPPTF